MISVKEIADGEFYLNLLDEMLKETENKKPQTLTPEKSGLAQISCIR